jgi:hypothetical protein
MATAKFYEFTLPDGTTSQGKMLATAAKGRIVIEEDVTGNVYTFEKSQIKEVVPYTVQVDLCNYPCQQVNILVPENSVKCGDLLVLAVQRSAGGIGFVSKLNTKSKSPVPCTSCVKLVHGEQLAKQ